MQTPTMTYPCRFCGHEVTQTPDGTWVAPDATGDDSVWREHCPDNDTERAAPHDPERDRYAAQHPHYLTPEQADQRAGELVPIHDFDAGGPVAYALPSHAGHLVDRLNCPQTPETTHARVDAAPGDPVEAFLASVHATWMWMSRNDDGTEREGWPNGYDCADALEYLCNEAHSRGLISDLPDPAEQCIDCDVLIADDAGEGWNGRCGRCADIDAGPRHLDPDVLRDEAYAREQEGRA